MNIQLNKYTTVVILVNYNNERDSIACLNSLKNQTVQSLFVVIVDNASKNQRFLKDQFKAVFSELYFIPNIENVGFGRANNIGIDWINENISYEYLLLLNNDTFIEPDAIHLLIKAFNNAPNIGITTGQIMYESNRERIWYGGGFINLKRGWPRISDYNSVASDAGAKMSKAVTFISGCAMMFSNESISKINGFDDQFFMYCEDMELSLRAVKMGYTLWYESTAKIYHRVQGSLNQKKGTVTGMKWNNPNLPFLFYHMKSNQWITMKKHLSISEFLFFNCYFWFDFILKILSFILRGRFEMIKHGYKTIKRICKYKHEKA